MDISSIYTGQKEDALRINQLHSINDSISTISIILPAGLIKPDPRTKKHSQKGTLKYEVIGEGKYIALTDSATFAIPDTSENINFLSHTWTFKAPTGQNYFVKATYSVPGIPDDFLLLEYFSKKNHLSQSWFRFQKESGEYIPGNITAYSQPLRLVTTDSSSRKLLVKLYSRNFPTPVPPFVEESRTPFNYLPDSTFSLELKNGKTPYFLPSQTGFYFFQPDSSQKQGLSLFRMNTGFPKVTQHNLMREALRYITSTKEFQQLNAFTLPKMAVDSFWIANAGSSDIATELIRKYYIRVETANKLYTSYTDGWKTDRGMIFIVMGKPSKVYRSFKQEVWIYGEYDDPRALRFYFDKAINPFTDNDYVLIRNEYYKTAWYQSVQLWRR
ncbi:MAG: GWxTD domain-containing protein [Bacteroidales bacterium]|nr:GWxTD domain-containing protein [Bacteroidales bacterium]